MSGPARTGRAGNTRVEWAGSKLFGRLLDRLIWNPPARAWIGVVAFALIGIVAMQLWVVKLGVGIGHALEHAELLQRENSALAIEDSSLSSGERVERLALASGMVLAPPGALHFDTLRGPLDARLAAAALAKPAQTQSTATGIAGTGAATGAEASPGVTSDTEASPSAASATGASSGAGTETSPGATTGTEPSTGATTGTETSAGAGGETASPQTPATQVPSGQTSPTGAPAAETPPAGTPAAPASVPAGTGGSAETTSPQTGSGDGAGGTQGSPGG